MLGQNLHSIITILFMLVIIILLAYLTTIFLSRKTRSYFMGRSIKVLERVVLSTNLSIIVIQVINKVYILAINNKCIEVIDSIEYKEWQNYKDALPLPSQKDFLSFFKEILTSKKPTDKNS